MNKKLIVITLLIVLVVPNAFAFKFFGKDISFGKQNQADETEEVQTQVQTQAQNRNLIDIDDATKLMNKDPYALKYMGYFEGKRFCLQTQERTAYFEVKEGQVIRLQEEPDKCYKIEATEEKAEELMNSYKNGEYMTAKQVMDGVKVPLRLKIKLAYHWVVG